MWHNLLEYWRELSFLGVASLPLVGLFFLGTKSLNWTTPTGYFTQLRLFIKRKNGQTQATTTTGSGEGFSNNRYQIVKVSNEAQSAGNSVSADLVAEYPITFLEKENWWKYCLPKSSKLKKTTQTTSVNSAGAEKECEEELKYKSSRDSAEINYLLKLGLKFLKLQHQINLMLIYHLKEKVIEYLVTPSKEEILKKCKLDLVTKQNYLKDFFISSTPISDSCLLTPSKVDLTLTSDESTSGNTNSEIKLDNLKKGTISGSITYSLSNYYGSLHDFTWNENKGSQETKQDKIAIRVEGKSFDFNLESQSSSGNDSLKFDELWKKYESRELKINDFCKDFNTGGGNPTCQSHSK